MTILFKSNKNGSIQQWSVSTFEDTYTVQFGQVDGAMQTAVTTCTGKHIGKSNETSAIQQAELEAAALVAKKLKSGYSTDPSAPVTVQLPMKVKSYQDQLHNVKFPCHSSAKLNGVNGMYKRTNGILNLYSRGGELYPPIPHLEPLVHQAMDLFNSNELNGELYIHGFALQDITSAVIKPNDNSNLLSFCIFDIADSTEQFHERAVLMHTYLNFDTTIHSTVTVVYNITCLSTAQLDDHYMECTNFGYEGTVVKNYCALYEHNIRSSNIFKYKLPDSKEFLILGYQLDKNNIPVFNMTTGTQPFKASPIGTKEYWSTFNPEDYINQWATVEFEVYSNIGKPLKPIFIGLRDCTPDGKPLV